MKKTFILIISSLVLFSCNESNKEASKNTKTEVSTSEPQYFGEKITADNAMPTDSLRAMMGNNTELNCKLIGKIDAVCQKKGCWMELKNTDGSSMRVTFKDYGFFMPKDCSGKTAIVEGIAKIEVTSIADLKEYAKDDGQSKEDIAKITEPLQELVFEAKGVILQ
jgi:hypothetical protein